MARKPHNFTHFQNLVNELKNQNSGNLATLESKIDLQTNVLQSIHTFFVSTRKEDLRRLKEAQLEADSGSEKKKSLLGKGSVPLPKFSGKGFMGMLGDFLSTALMGIPGGLAKFLPSRIGFPLMGKLVRGLAFGVIAPSVFEALEKAFSQDTFSGGLATFIDTYFAIDKRKSLAENIAGGATKGALVGFAALGIKGAIVGGLLGGALVGLSIMLGQDKLDSKALLKYFEDGEFRKHIDPTNSMFVGAVIGAAGGAKVLGPSGIIAGALLGGAAGLIAGMMNQVQLKTDKGKKSLSQAFFAALTDPSTGVYIGMTTGIGAVIGGILGGGLPGAIMGALAGNILGNAVEALALWLRGIADEVDVLLKPIFGKAAKVMRMIKQALKTALGGDFSAAIKMVQGEYGTDLESINALRKAGKLTDTDYYKNIAALTGDADVVSDVQKKKAQIEREKARIAPILAKKENYTELGLLEALGGRKIGDETTLEKLNRELKEAVRIMNETIKMNSVPTEQPSIQNNDNRVSQTINTQPNTEILGGDPLLYDPSPVV